jgi:glycosyltransferase involved in cell wall biosynthesis
MPLNLLYVIQNDEFGGGEHGFSQLVKGLDCKIFKVFVATTAKGRFYREIKDSGATVITIPFGKLQIFRALILLMRTIRGKNIQLIHSQGARADFFARIAGRFEKVPAIVSTVQMPVEGFNVPWPRKIFYKLLDRFSERFVDRFIVVSKSLRQHLISKHKITKNKISLIYNGVELDGFNQSVREKVNIREVFNIPPDLPIVGAVGRMVWQKGFEYLIRAAPAVLKAFPQTRFLIVGEGNLKNDLIDLANSLQIQDSFIFTGFLHDIYPILSELQVFVLPSLREGFPLIILEAMAALKPIVSTAIDGITEQIEDGVNGILVPPQDSELLGQAIIKLLKDRSLAKRLGEEARNRARDRFSVERMVTDTKLVYQQVLKEKGILLS